MPLADIVLNTEAHAFPRFEMGKLFKTGWERKPRDKDGKILPDPPKVEAKSAEETSVNADGKTVVKEMVTRTVQKERGAKETGQLAEMVTQTDRVGEAQVTGMLVPGEKMEGQVVVEGTRVAGS